MKMDLIKENIIAEKKTRSRGDNWTQEEKDIFMEIMERSAPIVENKKSDTNSNKRKHLEWLNVQKKLRELTGKPRDIMQLKGFWRRSKVTAKESISQHKRDLQATGSVQPPPSPCSADVKIEQLDFVVDEDLYDSDAVTRVSGQKNATSVVVVDDDVKPEGAMSDDSLLKLEVINEMNESYTNESMTSAANDLSDDDEWDIKFNGGNVTTNFKEFEKEIEPTFKKKKCHNNGISKESIYNSNIEFKKRTLELMEEEFKLKILHQKLELNHQELRHKLEIDVLMLEKKKKILEIEILKKSI